MNKRLIALALAVLMLLGMTACGKKAEETKPSETTVGTEATNPGIIEVDVEVPDPRAEAARAETQDEEPDTDDSNDKEDSSEVSEAETKSEETTPATTAPSGSDAPTAPAKQLSEYEQYNAMSGEEQMAFLESFDSVEAFFEWYNNAKAEHEAENPAIIIDGSVIDAQEVLELTE